MLETIIKEPYGQTSLGTHQVSWLHSNCLVWTTNPPAKTVLHVLFQILVLEFGNMLGYDAFCFGNHEFDDGMSTLVDFAANVNYPILAANMIEHPDEDTPVLGDVSWSNM